MKSKYKDINKVLLYPCYDSTKNYQAYLRDHKPLFQHKKCNSNPFLKAVNAAGNPSLLQAC
jgi:hypothetical protein